MVDPVASETWQSSSGTLSRAGGTTLRRGAWGFILRTATGSSSPVCCRGGGALRDRAARVRADGETLHLLIETPHANASRALQWLNVSNAAWFNARQVLAEAAAVRRGGDGRRGGQGGGVGGVRREEGRLRARLGALCGADERRAFGPRAGRPCGHRACRRVQGEPALGDACQAAGNGRRSCGKFRLDQAWGTAKQP